MVFGSLHEPPSYDEPQAEPVDGVDLDDAQPTARRLPVCRACRCEDATVCPHNGLCFACDRPNASDDYDDNEYEPPLDDDGPRSNGRIFL